MSRNKLWVGFLEAGAKSSPVVADSKLNTGNEATLYLFNQVRNAFIEYRRDIVEPKLRELNGNEADLKKELTTAYKMALAEFEPRGSGTTAIPERSPTPPPQKAVEETIDIDDDMDADDDAFDDDALIEGDEN